MPPVRDGTRSIPAPAKAPAWERYVALGDSLTEGLADTYPDGRDRGWADRLAQHLADRRGQSIRYANLAIRGRLLRPIVAEQVEPALALGPDLVSIWGGGNDLLRPNADPDSAPTATTASARPPSSGWGSPPIVPTGTSRPRRSRRWRGASGWPGTSGGPATTSRPGSPADCAACPRAMVAAASTRRG